jgi:integrase
MARKKHTTEMQAQLGHSDIRTTLDIYTQITDPEVARMVNQVTNRILGLGEEVEPGSIQ